MLAVAARCPKPEVPKISENYDEREYEELSAFDFEDWLVGQGQQQVKLPSNDNKQVVIKTLESFYAVPKLEFISEYGIALVKFSSPIVILDID